MPLHILPVAPSDHLADHFVFSSMLRGKNNFNSTKMVISVQNFVHSFFSYLPAMILIQYFSLLYHSRHIVPAGEWNHQCWNDIYEVDYYSIQSPVALVSILFHVSIPIQQLLNKYYDIHPETLWAASLHSCLWSLLCISTLYDVIVDESEQQICGNFELPRYILRGVSHHFIPCRIFLLYLFMFLGIFNYYSINNAILSLKFCYHALFILISNPF